MQVEGGRWGGLIVPISNPVILVILSLDQVIEAKEGLAYDNKSLEMDEGLKAGLQYHNTRTDVHTNPDASSTKF